MKNKSIVFIGFLLAFVVLPTLVHAYAVDVPSSMLNITNFKSSTQNNITLSSTITAHSLLGNIDTNQTRHYYLINVSNNRPTAINISVINNSHLIVSGFSLRDARLFTANLSNSQIENHTQVSGGTTNRIEVNPLSSSLFALEITTDNWQQGQYNISYTAGGFTYTIDPNISACPSTINTAGVYTLNESSITSFGSSCITITADDIDIDGQGNTITGDRTGGTIGITTSPNGRNNITIRNLNLQSFESGIIFGGLNTTNQSIINSNVSNMTGFGIQITNGDAINISGNRFFDYSGTVVLDIIANDTIIADNSIFNLSANLNNVLAIQSSNNVSILRNSIANSTTAVGILWYASSTSVNITANNITNVSIGITCSSNNASIYNNIINSTSANAINVTSNCPNATILSNTIENVIRNGVFISSANGINLTSNTFRNATIAINATITSFSTLESNTIFNSSYGMTMYGVSNSNITSNTIYNNTQAGILAVPFESGPSNRQISNLSISSNTLYGHTTGLASAIFFQGVNQTNHIYNNLVIANNTYGIFLNITNASNMTNNVLDNNTQWGILINQGQIHNISYNNVSASGAVGILLNATNLNNIIGNNITQGVVGIEIAGGNRNNITNNTILSSSGDSIWVILSSENGTYRVNGITSSSLRGFYVLSSNQNNITNNTIERSTQSSILIATSDDTTIENNYITNSSRHGIEIFGGTRNNLTLNNITNSSHAQYTFYSGGNATFTGNNYAELTQRNSYDLNLTNFNLTGLTNSVYYNLTTDYGSFFFGSIVNLSIKLMNLTDSGASITGCIDSAYECALITNNNNVVNLTNTTGSAYIDLGLFWDTSLSGDTSIIYIANYSGNWDDRVTTNVSLDGTSRLDGLTTFSTYGVITSIEIPIPLPSGGIGGGGGGGGGEPILNLTNITEFIPLENITLGNITAENLTITEELPRFTTSGTNLLCIPLVLFFLLMVLVAFYVVKKTAWIVFVVGAVGLFVLLLTLLGLWFFGSGIV